MHLDHSIQAITENFEFSLRMKACVEIVPYKSESTRSTCYKYSCMHIDIFFFFYQSTKVALSAPSYQSTRVYNFFQTSLLASISAFAFSIFAKKS